MYSQLLSSSMDTERVDKAHPAYPFIIRQLSADEAKVLEVIRNAEEPFELVRSFSVGGPVSPDNVEKDDFPQNDLAFPENVQFYMSHLQQLGLAVLDHDRQEPVYSGGPPNQASNQTGLRVFYRYLLTDIGARFLEACHSPSGDEAANASELLPQSTT